MPSGYGSVNLVRINLQSFMQTVLITYATMTGNSQIAATALQDFLKSVKPDLHFTLKNIRDIPIADLYSYSTIIFGISTWEFDLNPDSEDFIGELKKLKPNLKTTTWALFGLGDSQYEKFCPALPIVKQVLQDMGASIHTPTFTVDGYPHSEKLEQLFDWALKIPLV